MLFERLLMAASFAAATPPPAGGYGLWAFGLNDGGATARNSGSGTTLVPSAAVTANTTWVEISAGQNVGGGNGGTAAGILSDGTLWTWGDNTVGNPGVSTGSIGQGNSATSFLVPTQVGSGTTWAKVSQGSYGGLAIKTDGTLWSWGYDIYGCLGQGGGGTIRMSPTQVGSATNWDSVSTGFWLTVLIKTDGTLWTMGTNNFYATGRGTNSGNTTTPTQVGSATNWVQAWAGLRGGLAINSSGELWSWGTDNSGELARGTSGGTYTTPGQCGVATDWAKVRTNPFYFGPTFIIKTNGALYTCGPNLTYGTGRGTSSGDTTTPTQVGSAAWLDVYSLCNSGQSAISGIGLRADNTVWSWGSNTNGQTGQGTTVGTTNNPTQVGLSEDWEAISANGGPFALLLRGTAPTGTLLSWGDSAYYATGQNTTSDITTPTQVGSNTNWTVVDSFGGNAGGYGGFAIRSDGTLWSWGAGLDYGTGQGTTSDIQVPTQVGSATNWVMVSGFGGGGVGLKSDGTIWSWGDSSHYATGQNTTVDVQVPTQIGTDTNWAKISCFAYGCFAIKTDGSLWSWGYSLAYATGQNTTSDIQVPTQIGSATDWVDVQAFAFGGFALKNNGTLWSWGYSNAYATGQNTLTNIQVPTQIGSDTDWADISSFVYGGYAVKTNGKLYSWGESMNYATGQNTLTDIQVPTQVGSDTDWKYVYGGFNSLTGFATKTDNTVWSWGYGGDYVNGHGSTADVHIPTILTGKTNWTSISCSTCAFAVQL